MKKTILCVLSIYTSLYSASISLEDSLLIADKIWKNECAGKMEGLTHWGEGESFGSFGIGHFIWYSKEGQECFEETFPSLIQFLKQKKASIPIFLEKNLRCPWSSREEFYQKIHSSEMISLRQMLFETRGLQALFIVDRFEKALQNLPLKDKQKILQRISCLTSQSKGLYAVIDYLNFKGSGLSEKERYQGQGWGLLQVLFAMTSDSLVDFVKSAKEILAQRVKNAPPDRKEERWLMGWNNRLDTYL